MSDFIVDPNNSDVLRARILVMEVHMSFLDTLLLSVCNFLAAYVLSLISLVSFC